MNLNNLAFAPSGEGPLALWLVFEVRADRAPEMAETSRALSCALRPFPDEFRGRFHGLRWSPWSVFRAKTLAQVVLGRPRLSGDVLPSDLDRCWADDRWMMRCRTAWPAVLRA